MSIAVWLIESATAALRGDGRGSSGSGLKEEEEEEDVATGYQHPLLSTDQIVQYLWTDPDRWRDAAQHVLSAGDFTELDKLQLQYLNVSHCTLALA